MDTPPCQTSHRGSARLSLLLLQSWYASSPFQPPSSGPVTLSSSDLNPQLLLLSSLVRSMCTRQLQPQQPCLKKQGRPICCIWSSYTCCQVSARGWWYGECCAESCHAICRAYCENSWQNEAFHLASQHIWSDLRSSSACECVYRCISVPAGHCGSGSGSCSAVEAKKWFWRWITPGSPGCSSRGGG